MNLKYFGLFDSMREKNTSPLLKQKSAPSRISSLPTPRPFVSHILTPHPRPYIPINFLCLYKQYPFFRRVSSGRE